MTAKQRNKPVRRRSFHWWLFHAAITGWLVLALFPPPACRPGEDDRPTLALLADTSESMSLQDTDRGESRLQAGLAPLLATSSARQEIAERFRMEWYGFAEDLQPAADCEALGAVAPAGAATRIVEACGQVLDRPRATPLAGLVVISDGRSSEAEDDDALIRKAAVERVPIYVVPVGQPAGPASLSLVRVDADSHVWVGDVVVVEALAAGRGLSRPADAALELIDLRTGRVLGDRSIVLTPDQQRVEAELCFQADEPGEMPLEARLTSSDGLRVASDRIPLAVEITRPKLRVLYVEGYPRHESRFLRSLLTGRTGIELIALSAWTDAPADWPSLDDIDVVLLGDVAGFDDWLADEPMRRLARWVDEGGGLGVVAGPRGMPGALADTPIAGLLPLRIASDVDSPTWPIIAKYSLQWTRAGLHNPLARFGLEPQAAQSVRERLPGFYWRAAAGPAKPGAVVLAETAEGDGAPTPLLVLGRYGRGRTLYLGTDETWRWRSHPQGDVYERFWMQVLHYLSGGRRAGEEPWVALAADPLPARVGRSLRLLVRPAFGDAVVDSAVIELRGPAGWRQTLRPNRGDGEIQELEAQFVPPIAGPVRVTCAPPIGSPAAPAELELEVLGTSAETDDLWADPDRLERLATRTGGKVIASERLAETLLQLPDPRRAAGMRVEWSWIRFIRLGVLTFMCTRLWMMRRH
jgi:hypothetical protein